MVWRSKRARCGVDTRDGTQTKPPLFGVGSICDLRIMRRDSGGEIGATHLTADYIAFEGLAKCCGIRPFDIRKHILKTKVSVIWWGMDVVPCPGFPAVDAD